MYQAFFGFRERPFQLTPNPRYLFLNPGHREALATLRYGLTRSLGITLLLGEAGTGKTTLLRAALRSERSPEHRYALLTNPTLSPADFYEILADAFRLTGAGGSKGRFLLAFERDLLERHRAGCQTALVVDEAQSLTHDLFEEIRLLANLETDNSKLVNLVLVGQPELADRLNDPSLRQFKQRVMLRCVLEPLDLEWTGAYIAARLQVAGAIAGEVFTSDAVRAIYEASRGIPRTIGVVCENALLAGYAAQKKPIRAAVIADVCGGLDIPLGSVVTSEPPARPSGVVVPLPPRREAALVVAGPPDAEAPQPDPAAPAEPRRRLAVSRLWFSSKKAPRPEPAPEAEAAASGTDRRIFKFF